MMKARQHDRRFFSRHVQPHVYAIEESNAQEAQVLDYFYNGNSAVKTAMETLRAELRDAKEYGSILNVSMVDFAALYARFEEIEDDISLYKDSAMELLPFVQCAEAMAQKYHVVVTNPPYMGNRGMSTKLNAYVQANHPSTKSDMFAVFIERCRTFTLYNYFFSMITQPSFLFLTVFENLRKSIIQHQIITNLLHMGRGIFGIDFGSTAFVVQNSDNLGYVGAYMKLHQRTFQYIAPEDIEKLFLETKKNQDFTFDFNSYNSGESEQDDDYGDTIDISTATQKLFYTINQLHFVLIPGTPIAYWLSEAFLNAFQEKKLGEQAEVITGMTTGKNSEFLRLWHEIDRTKAAIGYSNISDIDFSIYKWIPYSKGGNRRNWTGNADYLVNWTRKEEFNRSKTTLQHLYLREALTWPFISSGKFSARYLAKGFLWDVAGSPCFFDSTDKMYYTLGFLCTKIADLALKIMNPTINVQAIDLAKLPLKFSEKHIPIVTSIVNECIRFSDKEWNAFETSWDFQRHPLIAVQDELAFGQFASARSEKIASHLSECYREWESQCERRFCQLKANEEALNRIFIDIYGLQDELTSEVEDKDVTVRKADLQRDVKSLISYAVGCMFGRYSLDVEGLAYAGGEWDESKYATFAADKDNVIPICDDEYFEDDIVTRFVEFIRTVYGSDTLEENLKFIADALGGKGNPRQVIRNYFLNDFFKDHCKIYQKRPIYWLFDSGKKNGFKCLVYMHRYRRDTIARIRTDYVHEQQSRYRTAIEDLEQRIANAKTSERVKLSKELKKLTEQAEELRKYEELIHHLADQMIEIDLDDGVKVNYEKFKDVLGKIK